MLLLCVRHRHRMCIKHATVISISCLRMNLKCEKNHFGISSFLPIPKIAAITSCSKPVKNSMINKLVIPMKLPNSLNAIWKTFWSNAWKSYLDKVFNVSFCLLYKLLLTCYFCGVDKSLKKQSSFIWHSAFFWIKKLNLVFFTVFFKLIHYQFLYQLSVVFLLAI